LHCRQREDYVVRREPQERIVSATSTRIAILGGGEEELNVLSEFHRTAGVDIVGIYDRDPRAVALEIAEIIGIPRFSDDSFLPAFSKADYVIVTAKRRLFDREIELLKTERKRIINPAEAVSHLTLSGREKGEPVKHPWPVHLEEALQYMNRITDRERLLKWLLEISVRAVEASSGSIMLHSEETKELYIGYASGLSAEIMERTRQKLGSGIAGQVAVTLRPRLISEIIETPLYREGRDREEIQSAISTPIVHGERLIGVLNVSTNRTEKRLTAHDVETIQLLAEKIAPILDQHLRIDAHEIRELEFQIRNYLETLFHNRIGFHEKFTLLCRFLAEKLEADTVTVYTATDEGDWLILGGSDQQIPATGESPRIHCNKGILARAYMQGEEVLMTEASQEAGFTLKLGEGVITSIYIPLVHNEALGVLVMEFSQLKALQRFFRLRDPLKFQVAFFTYSQLHEVRQSRRLESLEELSALAPSLVAVEDLPAKIRRLPQLLSALVKASMGSLHYEGPDHRESAYYQFPEEEDERHGRIAYDDEMLEKVTAQWEPVVMSYLSAEIGMIEKPPLYRSVIGYPLYRSDDVRVVYIGYDKTPHSPLDSSIFGEHEIDLIKRVGSILKPILSMGGIAKRAERVLTFDDLLRSNQKLLLERINEEIERAERYHHGFVLTVFVIRGLKTLFETDYHLALGLVNELSMGIRQHVRKTDFFSWIEPSVFAVLSVEGYQRIGILEGRITAFIIEKLTEKTLYDPQSFGPSNGYAMFPGKAETAADLIREARSRVAASP
jgi:GAF domain-containing protein/GGDEF domain-containing protein